jgi:ABC-type lipoprotein release transport system permease subunit
MSPLTLVLRGLVHYRRTHAGVLAGCAVSAAVLVGALFVGDSVRGSLDGIARARLGRVESALDTGTRTFRDDLAARLGVDAALALKVPGMALREGGPQVNRVEVLGVDGRFLGFAAAPSGLALGRGRAALGAKLAAALGAKPGDEVALRVFKPGLLARDAPLASSEERETRRGLFTVDAVLSDAQLGRFGLKSDQAAPHNAFLPLRELQELLEMEGRANLAVAAVDADPPLRELWTLADAGLSVREAAGVVQVQTDRIYLDPAVARKAMEALPGAVGMLAYLVDAIEANGKRTPYSFMTALTPRDGLRDDEILVSRWLAERLGLKPGDETTVTSAELTATNEFVPRKRSFKVKAVLEMEALAAERALVPEFPGLTDVESCSKWKIGRPMDEKELKDPANEEYWKKYKQTPKAIVTLAAGQAMWANRYGDLMALRTTATVAEAGRLLREALEPKDAGLAFRPARDPALRAASESMDLGQLFLGMSVFLIAASLVLTAMLFVFSVEQRAREMGVLRAVGWTPGRIRGLFVGEAAVLALAGSAAGVPLGWAFAKALLWGLSSAWSGAVADAAIAFHATPASAVIGGLSAAVVSLLAVALAMGRQAKRPVRELVSEDFSLSLEQRMPSRAGGGRRRAILGIALSGAVTLALLAARSDGPAGGFFGAGALLLVAGIAAVREVLARVAARSGRLDVSELGLRNAARRPGRAVAAATMLACGSFVVLAVATMKEDLSRQSGARRSGTGGFAVYAETSVPVSRSLNDSKVREDLRLKLPDGVAFVPLRVRDGDDASCLNLNASARPPLVGVDPETFKRLDAFVDGGTWDLLERDLGPDVVPALVGDAATALWKLKVAVGPEAGALLDYEDERGAPFKVKLVGALPERLTLLQGRLLVSRRHLVRLFPSEGGERGFLVDAPSGREGELIAHLSKQLETFGFDGVRSVDRLREFYTVEGAYLGMFLVLGGLGLLLGTSGLGVLVLRSVMERRGELALLRAVGYAKADVSAVVGAEHRFLLAAGLGIGTLAAAVAVIPAALQPGVHVPFGLLLLFLLGTLALSLLWISLAARAALRGDLLPALRQE